MDVFKTTLHLSETTLEGVEHIYQRTMLGYFEDTAELFTDVADSFHEIRRAMVTHFPDYEESEVQKVTAEVVEGMQMLLLAYEGDREIRPMVVLQFSLLPAFRRWQTALHESLGQICAPSMN